MIPAIANQVLLQLLPNVVLIGHRRSHGSGVLWSPNLIVTNDHVAHRDKPIVVFNDGTQTTGTVVARDRKNDLAAVYVPTNTTRPPLIADTRNLKVGQIAVSLGHPRGVLNDASIGIVSGIGGSSWMGDMDRELIQLDISLAPGSSGGPIADSEGKIIGIAAMVASPGIGLAVPSNVVTNFIGSIRTRYRDVA